MIARLALAGRFALRHLRADAVTSLLAAAMLAIGAGTISFVLSLGAMAAAEATRSLAALGPNVVVASLIPTDGRPPRRLDPAATRRAMAEALGVEETAALGIGYARLRIGTQLRGAPVIAFDGEAPRLLHLGLAAGRWVAPGGAGARECVLGWRLADGIRPGDLLLAGDRPCTVVGTLAPAPRHALLPADIDTATLVSLDAAARLDIEAPVSQFVVRMPPGGDDAATRTLLLRYAASAWPWAAVTLRSSGELIATLAAQFERQARLYALVASVAVAAAAIGLCAMMLAQVRARRRELGVRLAIGALPADIVLQILAEALLIGFAAGLLGNLGALALLGAVSATGGLPLVFDLPTAVATTLGTVAAGAVSGGVPAVVAARTDPVHSIRT